MSTWWFLLLAHFDMTVKPVLLICFFLRRWRWNHEHLKPMILYQSMRCWPVPKSYNKDVPSPSTPGAFWEDRGDWHHCGVDLYAPYLCDVISSEDGKIVDIGVFTSPLKVVYWNTTYYVLVQNKSGPVCRYAELYDVSVSKEDCTKAGQILGHVGQVLQADKITSTAPLYIQLLKKKGNLSMLHFERYSGPPIDDGRYCGGNWFDVIKPVNIVDPTDFLFHCSN